jgi:hypothetical protein
MSMNMDLYALLVYRLLHRLSMEFEGYFLFVRK